MGEIALSCIAPLYEGSVTVETGAMLVVTDPRPWAFSAEANFELPAIKERLQTIQVTVGVESGALGVGWLASDGVTWVEHVVARTGTTGKLNLAIPAGTVGGKLVFDNQRADGEPSRAIIEGIRLILSDDDYDQAASEEEELDDKGTSVIHYSSTCSDEPASNCGGAEPSRNEIALSRLSPLYGGSLTPHSGGVLLVTDPTVCGCSAELEFDLPDISEKSQRIMVTVEVQSGRLGIGWLRQDGAGWVAVVEARTGKSLPVLEIPAGTVGGKLLFDNQRTDGQPSRAVIESIRLVVPDRNHFQAALEAEERGDNAAAIEHYKSVLSDDPAHVSAIAGLGRLRYVDPPTPVMDEMRRWRPADAVFEVIVEIRNPCNYRCFYCFCKQLNNTPVQRFDLDRVEQVYQQIKSKMIITTLDCGGGEPTVHPQFPELLRIFSRYGYVSIVSNNSQNPKRWLPLETAKRVQVRAALHPEAEEKLELYCANARYLIDAGCDFASLYIAHPTRLTKLPYYIEYFKEREIPFTPVGFGGEYDGKIYPHSYSDEEKELLGVNNPSSYWITRIESHVFRIRNFRGIPCNAGYSSIQIKADGTLRRCIFDEERVLDGLLPGPDICGVRACGCALRLEKLTQIDPEAEMYMTAIGPAIGLEPSAYDWIAPMRTNLDRLISENGYAGRDDALAVEAMRIYDTLMEAYGKDEFPE